MSVSLRKMLGRLGMGENFVGSNVNNAIMGPRNAYECELVRAYITS